MLAAVETEMADEGRADARKDLARLCLATREVRPVTEMIRYVAGPDGKIVPDLERKLPGRGAWITATREALEAALRQKAFARAFQGKAAAGGELPDLVERLLEKAALQALSLANKAGAVVTGFERVAAALAEHDIAGIIHASEAAADSMSKLDRKLDVATKIAEAGGRPVPMRTRAFAGEQLDLALGRANVVHAALLAHPASTSFLARCLRLERWRNGGPAG